MALAETLEGFLQRIKDSAETSSIQERQKVLRLLVKEVLVGPDRIVIRHSIPTRSSDPGGGYPLCGRSQRAPLRTAFVDFNEVAMIDCACGQVAT